MSTDPLSIYFNGFYLEPQVWLEWTAWDFWIMGLVWKPRAQDCPEGDLQMGGCFRNGGGAGGDEWRWCLSLSGDDRCCRTHTDHQSADRHGRGWAFWGDSCKHILKKLGVLMKLYSSIEICFIFRPFNLCFNWLYKMSFLAHSWDIVFYFLRNAHF